MDKKAFTKYILSLLLFGMNGVVASHISLSSYEIVFLRGLIGSALLIALFLLSKGRLHIKGNGKDVFALVLSGVAMGASWMFLYEAYRQIGVGLATLLYYCGPVIVMIISPLVFKEKLTAPKVFGFLIVLMGIFLVNGKAALSGKSGWGLICGAISAVLYSIMVIFNKQAKNINGMENSVMVLTVTFLTIAVFVGFKQRFVIHVPAGDWVWILILGLVNTGVGCYLYFSPLSRIPVQTVAVCGYLEPLAAVIFAALLLGEKMSIVQVIGAVCIIGGAMIGELIKGTEHTAGLTAGRH